MRNKSGRSNQKKFHLSSFLARRARKGEDETEWFLLEADLDAGPARRKSLTAPKGGWLIRILAVACLCVSIPMGLKWVNEAIFIKNEEFVLKHLDIQSDGMLTRENLAEISNVSPGMSLMEIDLDGIRNRIEKLAIVEEAVISREMPDRINIQVKERVPVAWLSCPPLGIRPGDMERGYLIDAEGILFRCLGLDEKTNGLPLIETFKMEEPKEGDCFVADGAESALDLLQLEGALNDFENMSVHEIRLRNEWSIQCYYRSGLQVTFGRHDIKRGIEDLKMILSQSGQFGTALATVNVAAAENIPVTFAGPFDAHSLDTVAKPVSQTTPAPSEDSKQKHLQSILKGG